MSIDLYFWQKSPVLGGSSNDEANEVHLLTKSTINTYNCLGVVRLASGTAVESSINFYSIAPIGMILKADTDSTSIYVTAEVIAGAYECSNADDIKLQFGIIKD